MQRTWWNWRKEECGLPMRFLYGSTVTGEPIHYTFICPPVQKKAAAVWGVGDKSQHFLWLPYTSANLFLEIISPISPLFLQYQIIRVRSQNKLENFQTGWHTKMKHFVFPRKAFQPVKILTMAKWNSQNKKKVYRMTDKYMLAFIVKKDINYHQDKYKTNFGNCLKLMSLKKNASCRY